MGHELRLAVRRLRQQPAFTAVAILTLALGLGVNTAIFTIAHALSSQELPVTRPSELYRLGDDANCCVNSGLQDDYSLYSTRLYGHLRDSLPEFQSLAGFQANVSPLGLRRAGTVLTESIPTQFVSGNYFQTLAVSPHLGRLLEPGDDLPGAPTVFVMSHRAWVTVFGGDPSLVGTSFTVLGKPATLVGIADARFFGETVRPNPAGVWLPLGQDRAIRGANALVDRVETDWLYAIGRARPGVTREQIAARATPALQQWLGAQAFLSDSERAELPRQHIVVASAAGGVRTLRFTFERPVTILLWMSGLVLLIAAANLANLLLARADRGQAAVRVALGASSGRMMRQSLIEGLVLSVSGGALGLLIARFATRAIVALAFPNVDFIPIDIAPRGNILLFAAALAVVTGVLFSVMPAWAMSRTDPIDALRGTGRGGGARGFMPRRTLVIVQVALSMILLTGAGLMSESLRRLENQRLGFEPDGLMVVHMNPPALAVPSHELLQIYTRILDNVRRIPGVAEATYATYTPMEGNNYQGTIQIAGYRSADGRPPNSPWNRVGPKYFDVIGTRVVRGRAFEDRELAPESRVVMVNEAFVRRYFPDSEPLGRRVGMGSAAHASDFEIIGVTEDVKYTGAAQPTRSMLFMPGMQTVEYESPAVASGQARSRVARALVLRMNGPSSALQAEVRKALAAAHPDFGVTRVVSMTTQISGNFRINRMLARLTVAYGLLALALAILGVYGVTAYGVAQRTREIGVRMALGADRARVVRGVMRGAVVQAVTGVVIGGIAAFYAARLVGSFLYEIDPRDPLVLGAGCLVLVLSAGAAAALPALRASRISPSRALRSE
jgi:predicted permease